MEYTTCPGSQVDYIHYCTVLVYVFHYSTYCMFTLNRTGELSLQITSLGSRLGISESEATSIIVRQLLVYVYVLLFMPLCQEATSLHKSRPWWRSGLARSVTSPALFNRFILLCWIYLKLVPLNTETKFGCRCGTTNCYFKYLSVDVLTCKNTLLNHVISTATLRLLNFKISFSNINIIIDNQSFSLTENIQVRTFAFNFLKMITLK